MYRMTDEEFETAVEDALDSIPQRFIDALDNIEVVVQNEPDPEQLAAAGDEGGDGDLLGLYEGVALTERADGYGFGEAPDVITVFKGPHERACDTREQVVTEIAKTVIHEIGHYFGLDDEKLYSMGY